MAVTAALFSFSLAYLALGDIRHSEGRLSGRGFALASLALTLLAAPAYVFWSGIEQVRSTPPGVQSMNNLRQLALALHAYEEEHGAFPPPAVYGPKGEPLLSWRVLLLPYLEERELFERFRLDEPWDGPHNKPLLEKMPTIFAPPKRLANTPPHTTCYQVIVGEGAAFERGRKFRLADFKDGPGETLLVVEAGAVPWTKPQDVAYDPHGPQPRLGGLFQFGFNAALADGVVRPIEKTVPEKTLRALITRDGGDKPGPDWSESP